MLFFFKKKTAYEMRISDWSSDVCSSDLDVGRNVAEIFQQIGGIGGEREVADARIAQPDIESEIDAANGPRFAVTILVIDILHPAHRIDAGASEKSDVVRGGRTTDNRGVAPPLYAGQIIREQRIAPPEHAEYALLLHLPPVQGNGHPPPARIEGGGVQSGPKMPPS